MPTHFFSALETKVLDALFKLLSSCASLLAEDSRWARQSTNSVAAAERLASAERGLKSLSLACRIIAGHRWQEERRAIRCGRRENNEQNYSKCISLGGREEHAGSISDQEEMALSDVLLFSADRDERTQSSFVHWPRLQHLQLAPERLDARQRGIGGSDANIILSGNDDRLLRLWQEKRGEAEPEDLSDKLPVMLGSWTEAFNRQWFEKLSGKRVTDAGLQLTCSQYRWRNCTLDGVVEASGAVFEAKHTNSFVKADEVLERYMPQLQHNMAVAKVDRAVLSVIFGNARYEMFEVAADWLYQLDLFKAEQAFWSAVLSGEPPVALPPPPAPRPVASRELCLEGNNAWASAAADWLQHHAAAKTHASACKTHKDLIDDDVSRAFGHGIEARRSKSGAVTIKASQ